jgi:quercetin dioxygenase-like cupin family protein
MKFTRLYCDSEGASHFEVLEEKEFHELGGAGRITDAVAHFKSGSLKLYEFDDGMTIDWHTPLVGPFVEIYLEGEEEIEVESGEKRRFGRGDVVIFENMAGKGHRAKALKGGRSLIITFR